MGISSNHTPIALCTALAIVGAVVSLARTLQVATVAEGIETEAEFLFLKAAGVRLFQGYWFAKPAFEELPEVRFGSVPGIGAVA